MKTTQVNMHEAKSQLSRLGEQVRNGERVVIAKAGEPYLELKPYRREEKKRRVPGGLKCKIKIADDFDETPQDIIEAFEGN